MITTRAVERADYQAWKPLWDGYNAFYGRSGDTALPQGTTDVTWARFHDPMVPVHAVVALAAGEVVGLAHYLFHHSTTQVAPSCYLQDLFTAPSARGRGVARALIDAVRAAAVAAGSPRLYWLTHKTNTQARLLYDRVAADSGFTVYVMA